MSFPSIRAACASKPVRRSSVVPIAIAVLPSLLTGRHPRRGSRQLQRCSSAWAALLVVLVACGGESSHTIAGSFELNEASSRIDVGDPCAGSGGYSDIRDGASVTVRDEDGTIIGTAALGGGILTGARVCRFLFRVPELPAAAFYAVEVSHRGEQRYSREQLEERMWVVALTLG